MYNDLFSHSGKILNDGMLRSKLLALKAHEADVLYIHTDLNFGSPNPSLNRVDILEILYNQILELGVKTIFFPTYTFSFCNKENYDPINTKCYMGALNEYARKQKGVLRSLDPLMSVCVLGKDLTPATDIKAESIGLGSTFDLLSQMRNVKYLFLGPRLGSCFTFMHYLEWKVGVPYRYDRVFHGNIIHDSQIIEDSRTLFVRYKDVLPNKNSYTYEDMMLAHGIMLSSEFGGGLLSVVDQQSATEVYIDLLKKDPNYFIQTPFDEKTADKEFLVKNMRAL